DWVRVEVVKAGICGTDIGTLSLEASPAMEPFGSFPAVLGHEILGRVIEKGPAVTGLDLGQRVVVDPMISCRTRGFGVDDQCPSWDAGLHCTCERSGEAGVIEVDGGPLRRGVTVGFHADLPGGWSERIIAHETQIFPVDDTLPDHVAVLI